MALETEQKLAMFGLCQFVMWRCCRLGFCTRTQEKETSLTKNSALLRSNRLFSDIVVTMETSAIGWPPWLIIGLHVDTCWSLNSCTCSPMKRSFHFFTSKDIKMESIQVAIHLRWFPSFMWNSSIAGLFKAVCWSWGTVCSTGHKKVILLASEGFLIHKLSRRWCVAILNTFLSVFLSPHSDCPLIRSAEALWRNVIFSRKIIWEFKNLNSSLSPTRSYGTRHTHAHFSTRPLPLHGLRSRT